MILVCYVIRISKIVRFGQYGSRNINSSKRDCFVRFVIKEKEKMLGNMLKLGKEHLLG